MGDDYTLVFDDRGPVFAGPSGDPLTQHVLTHGGTRYMIMPRASALRAVAGLEDPVAQPGQLVGRPEDTQAPEARPPGPARVLGLDPGFGHLGWAVVELGVPERVVAAGVVLTSKSDKKHAVLSAGDNTRRAQLICAQLRAIIQNHGVRAICRESESFVRNASAAAKVARGLGVQDALADLLDLPLLEASPAEIKAALGISKAQSKKLGKLSVARACERRLGGKRAVGTLLSGTIPSLREHPLDAYGAVVACLNGNVLRVLRGSAA